MKKLRRFSPGGCFSYVYLIVLSVLCIFPLIWLLVSAFKSSGEMLANPTKILPMEWTLENFHTVLVTLGFTTNIKNSLIVALCTTVIATFISALAAYGIIRFFPKLGNIMTKILITTYMFPSIMLVIPYAVVMNVLHLTNTRIALVLVYMSFSVPYAVWMLVGFFKTVPIDIEESGRIDGANRFQVFTRIVLPLVRPGIVSTAIYVFINAWNEFLYALLLVSSSEKTTLSVAVKTLEGADILNWGSMMAASAIVVLPSIIFFCIIQNKIAGGRRGEIRERKDWNDEDHRIRNRRYWIFRRRAGPDPQRAGGGQGGGRPGSRKRRDHRQGVRLRRGDRSGRAVRPPGRGRGDCGNPQLPSQGAGDCRGPAQEARIL